MLGPVITTSCDTTREIEAEAVIGRDGGVVEVTDPGSPAYGVRIEIPEGALEESAVVSISMESNAPALPDGFHTGTIAVDLDVSTELLDAVEIEFPVDYIPTSTEGLPCAFFYDQVAGKWCLTLPSDIDYDNMVMKVRTSHLSIWEWGWTIVDILTDGAISEAIQNALIEAIGEDRWNTLVGSAESLAEDIIDLAEEITTDAACTTIEGIKNTLSSAQEFLYSELQYLYEDPVGLCDDKLVWCDSMSVYFFENIPERLVELFVEKTVVGVCEAIVGHTPVLMVTNILSLGLALAYSPCVICYISLSELNPAFWELLGSYYVATFGVEMAEAALDDLGCYAPMWKLTQLTDTEAYRGKPVLSADGTKIAFTADIDGDNEIFIINSDGSGLTQLTHNTAWDYGPSISADGTKIAFTADIDGDNEIFIINSDGSGLTQLTHNTVHDSDPSISGDGTKIAFARNDELPVINHDIFIMNSDGSGLTQLTYSAADNRHPSISGDGTKIIFTSYDFYFNIFIMNSDGSGLTQLTYDTSSDVSPSISADGTKIAFTADIDGDNEIFIVNSDGSGLTQLTHNTAWDYGPKISGDGTKIAFGSEIDGNSDIFIMNSDGSGLTQLTYGQLFFAPGMISDDGTGIVFRSQVHPEHCDILLLEYYP